MQNLIVSEIEVDDKPSYYSVSRLKSYSTCAEYYKLKYVDKIQTPSLSAATLIGSLCHDALEYYHSAENQFRHLSEVFKVTSKKTLLERKIIDRNAPEELLEELWMDAVSFAQDCLSLYERASERYNGSLPIRKKDGGVAASPTSTSVWKRAEEALKLPQRRDNIDQRAINLNPDMDGLSLASIFAEAFAICYRYQTPTEVVRTIAVEFPISDYIAEDGRIVNPVPMPAEFGGEEGMYLNGYIDWTGMVQFNGAEKLAIVDYKSSKEDMQADQVKYNVQLYSYVYAYELVTGETVEVIGIHNLRSGRLVLVEVDRQIMQDVLRNLFFKHKLIGAGMFYKHIPDTGYSPCLAQFGKQCPYLKNCYPELYAKLNPNAQSSELEQLALELKIHA